MYDKKNKKKLCTQYELQTVHTKVCGVVFFVYTSIKSKKSKINPYNLIKDKI